LSFDNVWASGGREAGRNKIKKLKAYLPLLHFQGKKKKKNSAA